MDKNYSCGRVEATMVFFAYDQKLLCYNGSTLQEVISNHRFMSIRNDRWKENFKLSALLCFIIAIFLQLDPSSAPPFHPVGVVFGSFSFWRPPTLQHY